MSKRKIRSLLGLGNDIQIVLDGMHPFYGKMLQICGDGVVSKRILSDLFIESLINDGLDCALFDFDSYTLFGRINRFSNLLPLGTLEYNGITLPRGLSVVHPKIRTNIFEDIEECVKKGCRAIIIDYLDIFKIEDSTISKGDLGILLKNLAEKHEIFIIVTLNSRCVTNKLFKQLYSASDYVASISSPEQTLSMKELCFDLRFLKKQGELKENYQINYTID